LRCYLSNHGRISRGREACLGLDFRPWVSLHNDYDAPRLASHVDFVVTPSTHPRFDVEGSPGFLFFYWDRFRFFPSCHFPLPTTLVCLPRTRFVLFVNLPPSYLDTTIHSTLCKKSGVCVFCDHHQRSSLAKNDNSFIHHHNDHNDATWTIGLASRRYVVLNSYSQLLN
jgi:hypothetical protein